MWLVVLAVSVAGCTSVSFEVSGTNRPKLWKTRRFAVLPLESKGWSKVPGVESANFLTFYLAASRPGMTLVDRNHIDRLVKEQDFSASELASKNRRVRMGRLLGADAIIYGRIRSHWHNRLGAPHVGDVPALTSAYSCITHLKVVDVESGEILAFVFVDRGRQCPRSWDKAWHASLKAAARQLCERRNQQTSNLRLDAVGAVTKPAFLNAKRFTVLSGRSPDWDDDEGADYLAAALAKERADLVPVERAGLTAILKEQGFRESDLADPETRAAAGRILSVEVLVFLQDDGRLVQAIDVESGEVIAQAMFRQGTGGGMDLRTRCRALARALCQGNGKAAGQGE